MLRKKIGFKTVKSNDMELDASPSETEISIEYLESKSSSRGAPDSEPEVELNSAHSGFPSIEKERLSPFGSLLDGVKFKFSPTLILEILPDIIGEEFCTSGAFVLAPPPPHDGSKVIIKKSSREGPSIFFMMLNLGIVRCTFWEAVLIRRY